MDFSIFFEPFFLSEFHAPIILWAFKNKSSRWVLWNWKEGVLKVSPLRGAKNIALLRGWIHWVAAILKEKPKARRKEFAKDLLIPLKSHKTQKERSDLELSASG